MKQKGAPDTEIHCGGPNLYQNNPVWFYDEHNADSAWSGCG